MTITRKAIARLLAALKVAITALGSLSLMFAGSHGHAAPATNNYAPLLAQSQAAQASIARIVADIKAAGDGSVRAANIRAAISEAVAANPGITADMLATAINRLILSDEALRVAITAGSDVFDTDLSTLITSIITDTYMMQGKEAAHAQAARLRIMLGDTPVDEAMKDLPVTTLSMLDELRNIEPASGVYDG